ncbi:MAG: quinol:cytochrome c oxidoreductase monoheme cytochrome subunit [Bacteroidetes bacterium]|nr:quinol:cytochrome c oxidoreductase monoheme cytochrome subunit [Bacteroidota bacterium]
MFIRYQHVYSSVAKKNRHEAFIGLLVVVTLFAGCHSDMYDQPRGKPLAESRFFENGQVSRPLVEGTVPHNPERKDELLLTGRLNGQLSDTFPFRVTKDVLERGRERYNVYCSPCHGLLGDGKGMIVRRGFPAPPSLHSDTLRAKPAGHYVDVIAHGLGKMFPYADRVQVHDRWAITAYIRALQLSQHATAQDLSEVQRRPLAGE